MQHCFPVNRNADAGQLSSCLQHEWANHLTKHIYPLCPAFCVCASLQFDWLSRRAHFKDTWQELIPFNDVCTILHEVSGFKIELPNFRLVAFNKRYRIWWGTKRFLAFKPTVHVGLVVLSTEWCFLFIQIKRASLRNVFHPQTALKLFFFLPCACAWWCTRKAIWY